MDVQGFEPDESLWAKARGLDGVRYPLVRHLLDAAAMAMFLWDAYLAEGQRAVISSGFGCVDQPEEARALVGLCAGLHDVGKISGFQFCNRSGAEALSASLLGDVGLMGDARVRHDVAGMRAVAAVLGALGFDEGADLDEGGPIARIAEVVGGHHGRFHRYEALFSGPAYQSLLGGAGWADQRSAHARVVHSVLGKPAMPSEFGAPAAVLVTGVVVLADWLVSQESYVRERCGLPRSSLAEHCARSCADAERLGRDAGLLPVELTRKPFAEAYGINGVPNALQRSLARDLPVALKQFSRKVGRAGILVVTAAPGDGKSEAALEAERVFSSQFGTRGFSFLLPTMATSDQMHGRVADALVRQEAAGSGLVLAHSMAWLSGGYADEGLAEGDQVLVCDGDEELDDERARRSAALRPARWLRGAKRALLAQYAVGTIDQALMAVLPVRHNMLRLLGLSGKTFVVDEAHAYDPYMQVLLGRLLNWLGAYGVPVVLLSATLPKSVSDQLIKQYLQGAGHSSKSLRARSFPVPYPGWLYVDGAGGQCVQISEADREEQARQRRMTLTVQVEAVDGGRPEGPSGRLAAVGRILGPLLEEGAGCALVVCNTVGEAQDTYTYLCERWAGELEAGTVELLHARFPAEVREARTRRVTEGMGRRGPRPRRRVIVATQVVEQSLDLDADVVISDLAPMALLLQRSGRCWRHETWWAERGRPDGGGRPVWASLSGPRLVVLDPVIGGGGVPRQWGEIYHEAVLRETSQALVGLGAKSVSVPDDVQELVERVHGTGSGRYDFDDPQASAAWTAYAGKEAAQRGAGDMVVIPRARSVVGLDELHRTPGTEDEWQTATRLGADSVRLLCVYVHGDGRESLDVAGEVPLPSAEMNSSVSVADVRLVMSRTLAVNSEWFRDADGPTLKPPAGWAEHPMLGDLVLLRQQLRDGLPVPVAVGNRNIWLDEGLGLRRT
ncbi:CRISPR-associated helicase Cas3' [Streptomyces sp. NPDC060010]|uniref:CRISPR-associated helicase Cas3' n=1 Tax=Streptomyces sp. NPDC060010 TaxID=3347036 RepID=UPI0036BB5213